MVNVKLDKTAWREGYLAGVKQQRVDSNPYPFEDDRGLAWSSGYIEGKANPDTVPRMRPIPKQGE